MEHARAQAKAERGAFARKIAVAFAAASTSTVAAPTAAVPSIAPVATETSPSASQWTIDMMDLAKLKGGGALTDSEFERAGNCIMTAGASASSLVGDLKNVFEFYKATKNESMFASAKGQIFSAHD